MKEIGSAKERCLINGTIQDSNAAYKTKLVHWIANFAAVKILVALREMDNLKLLLPCFIQNSLN